MLFFFFFQAEDGIRDLTVTGVQTCALPILAIDVAARDRHRDLGRHHTMLGVRVEDRKSTRLNSSHSQISYAVFCLKKKKTLRQELASSALCYTTRQDLVLEMHSKHGPQRL